MSATRGGGARAPVAGRERQRWVTIYDALWMGFPQGVGKLGLLTLGALSRTEKQCFHTSLDPCVQRPVEGAVRRATRPFRLRATHRGAFSAIRLG